MDRTYGTLTYTEGPTSQAPATAPSSGPVARCWAITTDQPHVAARIKRIFPRHQGDRGGRIRITATGEVARDLEMLLGRWPLQMTTAHRRRLKAAAREHRQAEHDVTAILAGHRLSRGVREPGRPARDYQQESADLVHATGRLLCTDDLGLGKTNTALMVLAAPDALPVLVVTLTHLQSQWLDELALTWPDMVGHILASRTPYDPATAGRDPDVLVVNYAKLASWSDTLAGRIRTVVFDEAQELRHPDSLKWTAAAQIAGHARYRVGLTNTPIYNYGGEIHSVLDVIAPGELGTREEFGAEYGLDMGKNRIKVNKPDRLRSYLVDQGLMHGHTRAQVGRELPAVQLIEQRIEADLDALDRIHGDAIEMARFIVARSGAASERWRLRGEFDKRLRQATGIAKAPYVAAFTNLLLQTENRVILWGWHRAVYSIWSELLAEHNPVLYTGSESPADKADSVRAFAAGDSRVLMMSLRAGAGIDGLQRYCNVGVVGELDWSPQVHRQCIGRLLRDDLIATPLIYFLLADHGSDPAMAETLNVKKLQNDLIVGTPDAAITPVADATDRIHRLATTVLHRAGIPLPATGQHDAVLPAAG